MPKKNDVGAVIGELREMLSELAQLREQEAELEAEVQKRAKKAKLEALGIVDLCAEVLGEKPKRRVTAIPERKLLPPMEKTAPGKRNKRGARIAEFLATQSEPCTVRQVTEGIGADGDDAAERVRTGVALQRLRHAGMVTPAGRGLWVAKGRPTKAKNGGDDSKHAKALAWARAHKDHPKAKRVLEMHGIDE
jgi:hypothetical protein